mmetsp:Transcript_14073/g.41252  ORF Transcript_14073/g.41252 Transcript_14073/m.41252 type:complete len:281 (+) Transcript_14073:687-1529(+)
MARQRDLTLVDPKGAARLEETVDVGGGEGLEETEAGAKVSPEKAVPYDHEHGDGYVPQEVVLVGGGEHGIPKPYSLGEGELSGEEGREPPYGVEGWVYAAVVEVAADLGVVEGEEGDHVGDASLDARVGLVEVGDEDVPHLDHKGVEEEVGVCLGLAGPLLVGVVREDEVDGPHDFVHALDVADPLVQLCPNEQYPFDRGVPPLPQIVLRLQEEVEIGMGTHHVLPYLVEKASVLEELCPLRIRLEAERIIVHGDPLHPAPVGGVPPVVHHEKGIHDSSR